jgi:hypothetical protein
LLVDADGRFTPNGRQTTFALDAPRIIDRGTRCVIRTLNAGHIAADHIIVTDDIVFAHGDVITDVVIRSVVIRDVVVRSRHGNGNGNPNGTHIIVGVVVVPHRDIVVQFARIVVRAAHVVTDVIVRSRRAIHRVVSALSIARTSENERTTE